MLMGTRQDNITLGFFLALNLLRPSSSNLVLIAVVRMTAGETGKASGQHWNVV